MTHYFFDLVGQGRKEHDFQGKRLDSSDRARQIAELIATDLQLSADGKWTGWTVAVYAPNGECCFSIPIKDPDLALA